MKKIVLATVAIMLITVQAFAGTEMLTVTPSAAVGITASNYGNVYNKWDSQCMVGPIETNSIRITYSSPTTTPTSTVGHIMAAGSTLTLHRTITRDEVSNFLATAVSATSTVPVTCN